MMHQIEIPQSLPEQLTLLKGWVEKLEQMLQQTSVQQPSEEQAKENKEFQQTLIRLLQELKVKTAFI